MAHYQRLRDLREDSDLKQKHIAKLLYISQSNYSEFERGKREIPACHLITLAKFYKTSVDYLLGLTNQRDK